MNALIDSRVFDVQDTPLADLPRDAGLMLERLLWEGPAAPPVAAFQASI